MFRIIFNLHALLVCGTVTATARVPLLTYALLAQEVAYWVQTNEWSLLYSRNWDEGA
jgi:hypothetical protein